MATTDPTLGVKLPSLYHASGQEPVRVNVATWTADKYPHIAAVVRSEVSTITREQLAEAARQLWRSSSQPAEADIEALFVQVMMWGSGTTNGRGPRHTEAALASGAVAPTLNEARRLLTEHEVAHAYDLYRCLPGVGEAFFTKLLWVIGKTVDVRPVPLTLDSVVWRALGDHGWDSERAAGSKRWGKRYEAYLRACEVWARGGYTPDDIEYTLFTLGRRRRHYS